METTGSGSVLIALANRCLREAASRELDARIYSAVLGLQGNETNSLFFKRGRIFVSPTCQWLDAPRFTAEMNWAKTLLPAGLLTISREPQIVCATALIATAILDQPPPLWTSQRKRLNVLSLE